MITETTHTAQDLIDMLTPHAGKVSFMSDRALVDALNCLESKGIPTRKHEDYKYCDINAILKKEFRSLSQAFLKPGKIANAEYDCKTLVIVNGEYSAELSDTLEQKGVHVCSMSQTSQEQRKELATLADPTSDAFIALNTAFSGNGIYLSTEKDFTNKENIRLLYVSTAEAPSWINSRSFIHLGANSELKITEEFISLGKSKCFQNHVSEIQLETGARLESVTIQDEGPLSHGVFTHQAKVSRNANYTNITFTLSGQTVRNNHNVELNEEHCEAHLFGLFLTNDTQLVDNHTLMDHQKAHCESNELYKGVIRGKSTGVFNGKIFVRKDAQKTNAYQSSKNILLSDEGTINTKPQLEIYADDVKCSHGTSTGKIDEEAVFYLKARGISEESARTLLLQAFAGEVLDKVNNEQIRASISERLEALIS